MLRLGETRLTLDRFAAVALAGERCTLAAEARGRMLASREVVERSQESGEPIYGVNTGFGDLAGRLIEASDARELQLRLLMSHAAGVGEPLPAPAVRGMLLLRAQALARGYSGVRPVVVERLVELLDRDLLPVVPRRGSVGASGDLAPLAHLALPLVGLGSVTADGEGVASDVALAAAGLDPLTLEAKEGLALINGTQASTALVALAALEARRLVRIADLVGALSVDACRGSDACFDRRLHALRPHPGQMASAANLWSLLQGSEIRESHRREDERIQDPYSFRCLPQVHGAARDVLADVEAKLEIEMNAVTDNPLVFAEGGAILAGGNFHGEPIAFAADFLAVALAELGAISERRIEKLNQTAFSGLPPFLVEEPGLNSGFMLAQVTAAALASENKGLAHPASVDSIPTSADKEDHVSMSMGAALKLGRVVDNVHRILAIELLTAAQGIDLLRPLRTSERLEGLHRTVRERIARWDRDRLMAPDLEAAAALLAADIEPHLAELG